ncbi:MAG: hypothetical protein L3J54_14445 [Draconibacterium sp.]|nr:hypothetical protein [Draconibacterium sp.]
MFLYANIVIDGLLLAILENQYKNYTSRRKFKRTILLFFDAVTSSGVFKKHETSMARFGTQVDDYKRDTYVAVKKK